MAVVELLPDNAESGEEKDHRAGVLLLIVGIPFPFGATTKGFAEPKLRS